MRMRISLIFLVPVLLLLSLFRSAGAVQAATVIRPHSGHYCANDTCDGLLPHDTDGGSNCLGGGNLYDMWSYALKDVNGLTEATMHVFQSAQNAQSNGCGTFWATVYMNTTYPGQINVSTVRIHTNYPTRGDDDVTKGPIICVFPGCLQNSWRDGEMAGYDVVYTESGANDKIHGWVRWTDRYGTIRDVNSPDFTIP
jgi:hypothetical protein